MKSTSDSEIDSICCELVRHFAFQVDIALFRKKFLFIVDFPFEQELLRPPPQLKTDYQLCIMNLSH